MSLRFGLACAALALVPLTSCAQASSVEESSLETDPVTFTFITLGTGGGPRVQTERSQPANAVTLDERTILLDVGVGTQRQLKAAGLELGSVEAIFLSHHHIDHIGGLGPLLVNRWVNGLFSPMDVYGPPGTGQMVAGLMAAHRPVEGVPVAVGVKAPSLAETVRAIDIICDGSNIYNTDGLSVTAVENTHYAPSANANAPKSCAFSVEAAGRRAVYTGDTGPSEAIEVLARGADLLVSEVQNLPAIEASLRQSPLEEKVVDGVLVHLRRSHLSPAQVGQMAQNAKVGAVVMTHFVPGLDGEDSQSYLAGFSDNYSGPVTLASDLQVFPITGAR